MSHLTIFSLCILVMVTVFIFGLDYSHTKNQLAETRAALAECSNTVDTQQTALASVRNAAGALREQMDAAAGNCARALTASSQLFDLALPPQQRVSLSAVPEITLPAGGTTEKLTAGGLLPPAVGLTSAPVNTTPKVDDHAFTQFLNAW